MISINLYEITIQVINLLILIYFINKLLAKPLSSFLDKRTAKIEKSIKDSELAKAESEKLIEDQKKILKDAQLEAKSIRENASAAGEKEKENLKAHAKQQADELIEKAKNQINQEVKLAKQSLLENSVDIAVNLSQKIIATEIDKESNSKLVENYLKEAK